MSIRAKAVPGRRLLSCLLAGSVLSSASTVFAQDTLQANAAPGADQPMPGEIIVTAQKRQQSAQDVPISLMVTTGDALQENQIRGLQELTEQMPNVIVNKGGSSDAMAIRGVVSGQNGGFEQSVATFIDGQYYGRSKTSRSALFDVERVEILRGPQTTYFGNNTIAGALNVVTKRPGREWEFSGLSSYEFNLDEFLIEGAGGGPLADGIMARLAVRYGKTGGYIQNLGTGRKDPRGEDRYARMSFRLEPTSALTIDLKAEIGKEFRYGGWGTQMTECPPPPGFAAPGRFCALAQQLGQETELDYRRSSTPGEIQDMKLHAYLGTAEYDLDWARLTSITGYSDFKYRSNGDNDATPEIRHGFDQIEKGHQFSQELRLASSDDDRLKWMVGAYYQRDVLSYHTDVALAFLTPALAAAQYDTLRPYGPIGIRGGLDQTTKTLAGFGSLSYEIVDGLTATAGLRWTQVKKTANQFSTIIHLVNAFGGGVLGNEIPASAMAAGRALTGTNPHSLDLARKDNEWLPSFNLTYEASRDLTFYGTYSEGFKSGGFDQLDFSGDVDRLSYEPEYVKAGEIGVKGFLRGPQIRFNLAAFRANYSGLQNSVLQATENAVFFAISNVGKQVSQGFEVGFDWQINDNLKLRTELAYLDAKFKDYPNAGCNAIQQIQTPAGTVCSQDLSGARPRFAPKYSGSASLSYERPLGPVNFFMSGAVAYRSFHFIQPLNDRDLAQSGFAKVSGRIGIGDLHDRWELALIGRNLSNAKTVSFVSPATATAGSNVKLVDPPRQIAVQARVKF
jgi:iron complex outermembrane recepter protein